MKDNKIVEDFRHRDSRQFTGEYCKTLRCVHILPPCQYSAHFGRGARNSKAAF